MNHDIEGQKKHPFDDSYNVYFVGEKYGDFQIEIEWKTWV